MKVSEINIYPVKSLGGISLDESLVKRRGLNLDRRWMLVDGNGDLITQREISKMATVSVKILGNNLNISVEGFKNLKIPSEIEDQEQVEVRVWKNYCSAIVADNHVNNWFCEVLEIKCRLVFMPNETKREVNEIFNAGEDIVSFADGYPLLIIGENSLNNLNNRLENKIPMNRFRPNLVIADSESFEEDNWKKIKIGETVFRITKPCARCVVTTIEQSAGIVSGKEPLRTLAGFRKAKDVYPDSYEALDLEKNSVLFGQNLVAENFGETIKVGDEVEIIE